MNIKQQQILETAFDLFYHRGFHAVGINEIIKEAKVAKKTLYNHFQSKDELITATIEWHHRQIMEQLQDSLKLAVPGKDSILVVFEELDAWIKEEQTALPSFNGCYFNQAFSEFSAVHPDITALCLNHKKTFKNIFTEQVSDFEDNAGKKQILIDLFILLYEGVLANSHVLGQKNSAQQAIRYIENLLRFKR
jgi:AcrR family transcriptional regulator